MSECARACVCVRESVRVSLSVCVVCLLFFSHLYED